MGEGPAIQAGGCGFRKKVTDAQTARAARLHELRAAVSSPQVATASWQSGIDPPSSRSSRPMLISS